MINDMTKIPYVNMGVKISVSTSTIQPLSKVHFNIFNKKKYVQIFFVFSGLSFVFLLCLEGGQDHAQTIL